MPRACQGAPSNITVVHEGSVDPLEIVPTLAQHDLFLFPTRGENFGHVIHEALRAGLPLLISDQTPWNLLEKRGVGWNLSLADPCAFAERIQRLAGFDDTEYLQRCNRARALAAEMSDSTSILEDNRHMFLNVMAAT